jgi:plastocyanin
LAALAVTAGIAFSAACGEETPQGGQDARENAIRNSTNTQDQPGGVTESRTAGGDVEGTHEVVEIPAAEQGLAFAKTTAQAKAGQITLRMPNPASIEHNIALDEPKPVEGEVVGQGGTSEIDVNLTPGTYEYYCSVPGHREGGMVGKLTVD